MVQKSQTFLSWSSLIHLQTVALHAPPFEPSFFFLPFSQSLAVMGAQFSFPSMLLLHTVLNKIMPTIYMFWQLLRPSTRWSIWYCMIKCEAALINDCVLMSNQLCVRQVQMLNTHVHSTPSIRLDSGCMYARLTF